MFRNRQMNKLTGRESQVLKLIADGFTNQEISEHLALSQRTVEAHRARLMLKLAIHDVPGLVKYAIKHNITGVDEHGIL